MSCSFPSPFFLLCFCHESVVSGVCPVLHNTNDWWGRLMLSEVFCRQRYYVEQIDITSEDWVRLNHGSSLSGTSIPDFSTINQQASEFSLFYEPGSSHKRLKVGRSDGLGDIKCCKRDACSGNSATQEEGSSPSYFRLLRTMLLSIAIPNECHSSKNTTPKAVHVSLLINL